MIPQNQPCDLLLRAAWIVTQDEERRVIEDGGVAVLGDRIAAVGSWEEINADWASAEIRSHTNGLLVPGLINAHTHAPMTLFRGLADDVELLVWLEKHIWPLEARLTREMIRLGSLLACAEMIRHGTTCFIEGYMHEEVVGEAVDMSGMRAVLGEGFFQFPSPFFETARDAWDCMERLALQFKDHPRIRTSIFPHAVFTTDEHSLTESFELAGKLDMVWQIHCAESRLETELCLERFGKRPVPYLRDLGVLGPRTVLHHMVDISEEEMDMVAKSDAAVVHNPASNLKLGSGIAPVTGLLDRHIPVALGTDGAASNNAQNLFREMALAALVQKGSSLDPTALPAGTVLDMATVNGARAASWPKLGSLAPGKMADLAVLDISQPNMIPLYDPISHLAYAACGQEVVLTMVGGRVLYEDGLFTELDMESISRETWNIRKWVEKNRA